MSTYQQIKDELLRYQTMTTANLSQTDIENLKYNFSSEQTEVWVAAAKKIGALAAQGSQELKKFLQQMLIDEENIHRQRHALTALGVYFGQTVDANERFELLATYDDQNEARKEIGIEEKTLQGFIQESLQPLKNYAQRIDFLKGTKVPQNQTELDLIKDLVYIPEVTTKIDHLSNQYSLSNLEAVNSYQELMWAIRDELFPELETMDQLIDKMGQQGGLLAAVVKWYRQERVLDKLSIDNFPLTELVEVFEREKLFERCLDEYKKNSQINDWHLFSLLYAFPEIYHHKPELNLVIRGLIILGNYQVNIEYLRNLPYVLAELLAAEDGIEQIKKFAAELELMEESIEQKEIYTPQKHVSGFCLDLMSFYRKLESVTKTEELAIGQIPYEVFLDEKLISNYQNYLQLKRGQDKAIKQQKTFQVLNQISSFFAPRTEWKGKSSQEKNAKIVFDLIIKDPVEIISLNDKIEIVTEKIREFMWENEELLDLFLRELKYLYFNKLKEIKQQGSPENLIEHCQFQIYSVIDLIKEWSWQGTINKDIASIAINVFDFLWEEEYYQELFKLIFTVFSCVPEGKIISEMLKYSKSSELESFFEIYNTYHQEDKNSLTLADYRRKIEEILLILDRNNLPQEIKQVYQLLINDKLSFNRELNSDLLEEVSIFAVDQKLFLEEEGCTEERVEEIFRVDKIDKDKLEYKLLVKYILEPNYRYQLFKESKRNYDLDKNILGQEDEIELQLKLRCDKYFDNLSEVLSSLDGSQDNYFSSFVNERNYFNIEKISNNILKQFSQYKELINYFPYFERNFLFATIDHAKETILTDRQRAIENILSIQNEAEDELKTRLKEIEENYLQGEVSKTAKDKHQEIIFDFFLERGMYSEYDEIIAKQNNDSLFNYSSLLANLNKLLINPLILIVILLPFLPSFAAEFRFLFSEIGTRKLFAQICHELSRNLYLIYFFGLQILFYLGIIFILVRFIVKTIKIIGAKLFESETEKRQAQQTRLTYNSEFFLPKLIGVIFVAYMNIILTNEIWQITFKTSIIVKLILVVVYLSFLYFFIKTTQFDNFTLSQKIKEKRIWNTISLGLAYSYITCLVFNLLYSKSFYCENKLKAEQAETTLDKLIFSNEQAFAVFQLNMPDIIDSFFLTDFVILPESILMWTVQMFFIGVILEFFLQKEKIIDQE